MRPLPLLLGSCLAGGLVLAAFADGPADNIPDKVRPVPPPGIMVPDADRAELENGLADLEKSIAALRPKAPAAPYLPDVEIYAKAVRYALQGGEFFAPGDITKAKNLLKVAEDRCDALENGRPTWVLQSGPTALGYVSQIDGSVQPYG
ncbi:MAG TPA: hypothetical protein VFU47_16805, partial [Armatimonadota bacterium]|nr:hypothetical protein [Armatimonadota bacterium]